MEKNFPAFREDYKKALQNYFNDVTLQGEFPLFYNHGVVVKGVLIFKCEHYNGKEPEKVHRY
jgi:hypothetical protein